MRLWEAEGRVPFVGMKNVKNEEAGREFLCHVCGETHSLVDPMPDLTDERLAEFFHYPMSEDAKGNSREVGELFEELLDAIDDQIDDALIEAALREMSLSEAVPADPGDEGEAAEE